MKRLSRRLWMVSRAILPALALGSVNPIVKAETRLAVLVADPIVITQQPASQTVETNGTVTFTVGVSGSVPRYQWQFDGSDISLATNDSYSIPSVQPANAGAYRVIVSNPVNTVTSEVAVLTVTADTTPPRLVSAVAQEASQPPYYLLVRFDERVMSGTATQTDHYAITESGTTNGLVVSNAQVNANLVRLTASPWRPGGQYVLTVNGVADLAGNVILPDSRIGITTWQEFGVSTNSLWSWSEGFDLTGQDWKSRDYDESTNNIRQGGQWKIPDPSWAPIGRGVFHFYGFERPNVAPLNTVLSIGYPTYYFRTRLVTGTNPSPSATIVLTHLLDDGAAVYFNGTEIYRFNLPSGPLGYETLAASQRGIGYHWTATGEILLTNVLPGTNVIAAELHPQSPLGGLEPGIAFGLLVKEVVINDLRPQGSSGPASIPSHDGLFSSPPPTQNRPSAPGSRAAMPSGSAGISNLIHLSIDGGAACWIEPYASQSPGIFTSFHRLQTEGAGTFNARCDTRHSDSIPNHTCMLTGRPVDQPTNRPPIQHGFSISLGSYFDNGITIHNFGNPDVPYKASVFDVVHDRGLSTEFLCGKAQRLSVCERSYGAKYGAPDTIPPDNGPDKIDYSIVADSFAEQLVSLFLQNLYFTPPKRYSFLHFVDPDEVGHAWGWGSPEWSNSIVTMDRQIGRILDAAQNHPALSNHTAVLVTADHGGDGLGDHNHGFPTRPTTFQIPFFVWGPGIPAGTHLYDLLSNRWNPGTNWVDDTAVHQPIRNGDSGNLALRLLGLPPIPGSFMVPKFEWDEPSLTLESINGSLVVSWSCYATNFQLEASDTLADDAPWQPVTEGIVQDADESRHTLTDTAARGRFYRLKKSAP